jgi:hypothetical protein
LLQTVVARSVLLLAFSFQGYGLGLHSFALVKATVLSLVPEDVFHSFSWPVGRCLSAHHDYPFEDDQSGRPGGAHSLLNANFEVMGERVGQSVAVGGEVVDEFAQRSLLEHLLFL